MKRACLFLLIATAAAAPGLAQWAPSGAGAPVDIPTGYVLTPASITHSVDTATVTAANSVACPADDDRFLRMFDLDGFFGITDAFTISSVDFGVETSLGASITVNLYTIPNGAPFVSANLTLIGSATESPFTAPDGTVHNFPVIGTVADPTADDLVVEIFAPDFTQAFTFFPGSNANGETDPTYLQAAGCGAPEPITTASVGFPNMHLVMVVNGDVDDAEADLEVVKTGAAAGSQVVFTVTVTNNGPDDATGVVVTDPLPPEVAFVSDDCGGMNVPPWTWNIGNLAFGASAVCNITCDIVDGAATEVVNTAGVIGNEPDPVLPNSSSTVTVSVLSVLDIPTLNGAGLLALLLAISAAGFWMLRRKA